MEKLFFNRELSWLNFNERVLMEGRDSSLPILERLKFSGIFSNNLDEFFMVRMGSIKEQIRAGYEEEDSSGDSPQVIYEKIVGRVKELVALQHEITRECLEALKTRDIEILEVSEVEEDFQTRIFQYFHAQIFPVLTPMAVDFSRPFPYISGKALYIAARIKVADKSQLAIVQIPQILPRLIPFKEQGKTAYLLLEDIILSQLDKLFPGHSVESAGIFRITRNADLELIQDVADDLLLVIEEAVKKRKWGEVIRLEIKEGTDPWIQRVLQSALSVNSNEIYQIPGMMELTAWLAFSPPKGREALAQKPYKAKRNPQMTKGNIFKLIREGDVFVHHPYESFDVVVDLVQKASEDPKVLAIKQTLYRVSGDSAIIRALETAAERGKQVTVLVELMARFDEENNISWAKRLEKKGVNVIYGLVGYKTHSKITLIVRKEMKEIRRYVHLGTGNYNNITAKRYTDMGYFTAKESYGSDASMFFNMISGFANEVVTHTLVVAPYNLREKFYELIDTEVANARMGKKARIIAKMNALVDDGMVDRLYEASKAGVRIELIVRGICTLVPGVQGLSENIQVKSIIGEFLEHSRIYYFYNDGRNEVYLSSADWMTRNLNRRIELLFPVQDPVIARRIRLILQLYLGDNVKSWRLDSHGNYLKVSGEGEKALWAHEILKELQYKDNESFIAYLKERM
ncbi:MAG: hypothetical protein AVO33_09345 [delta proteobacterium ML8_F1]|nr:MAG: hypothetical protein AVO33_09345 [delta proteobacterium ML8_F1]